MVIDRYGAVGLHRNPFAGEVSRDHPAAVFVDRGLASPPSAGACTLVQVIGDKGAGKTTQVQAWRRASPGPYHYVPEHPYRDRWKRPPVAALVYADEIDRMPTPLRRRWFRRLASLQATVVAGTHQDLSRLARRCGLAVETHRLGPVDLDTLRAIVDRRLHVAARDGAGDHLTLNDSELEWLHVRSAGSIRAAETHAHQLVAERVERAANEESPRAAS